MASHAKLLSKSDPSGCYMYKCKNKGVEGVSVCAIVATRPHFPLTKHMSNNFLLILCDFHLVANWLVFWMAQRHLEIHQKNDESPLIDTDKYKNKPNPFLFNNLSTSRILCGSTSQVGENNCLALKCPQPVLIGYGDETSLIPYESGQLDRPWPSLWDPDLRYEEVQKFQGRWNLGG